MRSRPRQFASFSINTGGQSSFWQAFSELQKQHSPSLSLILSLPLSILLYHSLSLYHSLFPTTLFLSLSFTLTHSLPFSPSPSLSSLYHSLPLSLPPYISLPSPSLSPPLPLSILSLVIQHFVATAYTVYSLTP
jgi:hypothetical protein